MGLTDDFITEAARLNHRDGLTQEQLDIAIPKKELILEGIVKNEVLGDQLRRVLDAKEKGVWTAEALALQDWSLLNVGNAFGNTLDIFALMAGGFVGGNGELSERAAILHGWQDYEPEAGSRIITYDDMPDAARSFFASRNEENSAQSALDTASAKLNKDFPQSAAEPAPASEAVASVELTIDNNGLG